MAEPSGGNHRGDSGQRPDAVADNIDELVALARGREHIVALTGAGISTESGIPDYRGPQGIWTTGKLPRIADFASNPETRREYWENWAERYPASLAVRPNQGHFALVRLEEAGVLDAIVTQNIDGLHVEAGNAASRVLELHGTRRRVRCLDCGTNWSAEEIYGRIRDGERVPACTVCGGPLRSATVLFGEPLPVETLRRATEAARSADLLLVVGSSLVVSPAARLPLLARRSGATTAIINREPTRQDDAFNVVVRGGAGPNLSRLVQLLGAG